MAITMEGIFINGEKAKFHPEDILDTDASQYTEEIGESVTAYLTEHLTNPSNPPIDTSLTIAGAAADAKETGDQISQLKSDLNAVEHDIYDFTSTWGNVTLSVQTDGRYDISGVFHEDHYRRYAIIQPVTTGEHYRLSTVISSTLIPAILFYNGDTFLSYEKTGTGTQETVTNYEFTIPSGANKLIVQNSTTSAGEFKLEKEVSSLELNVYTKAEVDEKIENQIKRYGVKWAINNNDDLGARCFDAEGLTATIGIGPTDGASDFDSIYPWSEIKRCNISKNVNGAEIVTFEGETGFALDGTNGDVFVFIPKFSYERYIENGYEYHVVSKPNGNTPVHPAFIDGSKILDGIFIGAYEGSVSSLKLHSISGVIPANNYVPGDFLTYAQANGTNYSLYGIKEVSEIWVLAAVEFGCRNSNQIWGYGAANFEQPSEVVARDKIVQSGTSVNTVRTTKWSAEHKGYMPVGSNVTVCDTKQTNILTQAKLTACVDDGDYTDWTFDGSPIDVDTNCFIGSAPLNAGFCESAPSGALSWHTGRANWISESNTRNPMRYRWIENVVGNVWHFLPDITFSNCQMYICDTIAKYGFGKTSDGYVPKSAVFPEQTSNGSKADSANVNYWIDSLNNDPLENGVLFGRHYDTSLVSTKSFGAYYYMKTGTKVVCNGGGFDHLYRCNLLTNRAWDGTSIKWHLYGARLIYKPVS